MGLIVVLAAAAPLIAQVLKLPSILLLLALGFGAGAIGALDPNALLGEAVVSAVVSISVGVILFESGLNLKLSDLRGGAVARVARRLVTLGILVTWAVGTVASHLLFDLTWEVALVLGAVLVVSGPTVVGPLLDFIRPSKTVGRVLKWEGTLADPIGATLGVVVYQAVLAGQATAGREILDFFFERRRRRRPGTGRGRPGDRLGALVPTGSGSGGHRDLDDRGRRGGCRRPAPRRLRAADRPGDRRRLDQPVAPQGSAAGFPASRPPSSSGLGVRGSPRSPPS